VCSLQHAVLLVEHVASIISVSLYAKKTKLYHTTLAVVAVVQLACPVKINSELGKWNCKIHRTPNSHLFHALISWYQETTQYAPHIVICMF
jgi:hypothetical protein